MLILPIVNKKKVMNVEIKLKNAYKVKQGVLFESASESEIIVNREKFSDSSFSASRDVNAPIDFIRSKSILYPRRFLVTTRSERDSAYYDVYDVPQPPKQVSPQLDGLYSRTITDMRKEIPGQPNRGRYVSFKDLGLDEALSDDKIATLQGIIKSERDSSRWPELFRRAGIMDVKDTIDFINNFECTVLSDTEIPEDSLRDTLRTMAAINTRDYRNLKKYYQTARDNKDIYTRISYVSKMIYDEPIVFRQAAGSKEKQFIKKKEENEFGQAA